MQKNIFKINTTLLIILICLICVLQTNIVSAKQDHHREIMHYEKLLEERKHPTSKRSPSELENNNLIHYLENNAIEVTIDESEYQDSDKNSE